MKPNSSKSLAVFSGCLLVILAPWVAADGPSTASPMSDAPPVNSTTFAAATTPAQTDAPTTSRGDSPKLVDSSASNQSGSAPTAAPKATPLATSPDAPPAATLAAPVVAPPAASPTGLSSAFIAAPPAASPTGLSAAPPAGPPDASIAASIAAAMAASIAAARAAPTAAPTYTPTTDYRDNPDWIDPSGPGDSPVEVPNNPPSTTATSTPVPARSTPDYREGALWANVTGPGPARSTPDYREGALWANVTGPNSTWNNPWEPSHYNATMVDQANPISMQTSAPNNQSSGLTTAAPTPAPTTDPSDNPNWVDPSAPEVVWSVPGAGIPYNASMVDQALGWANLSAPYPGWDRPGGPSHYNATMVDQAKPISMQTSAPNQPGGAPSDASAGAAGDAPTDPPAPIFLNGLGPRMQRIAAKLRALPGHSENALRAGMYAGASASMPGLGGMLPVLLLVVALL